MSTRDQRLEDLLDHYLGDDAWRYVTLGMDEMKRAIIDLFEQPEVLTPFEADVQRRQARRKKTTNLERQQCAPRGRP